jgi:hypothetical protein
MGDGWKHIRNQPDRGFNNQDAFNDEFRDVSCGGERAVFVTSAASQVYVVDDISMDNLLGTEFKTMNVKGHAVGKHKLGAVDVTVGE